MFVLSSLIRCTSIHAGNMAAACTTRALGLRPAPAQLSSTRRPASRAARSTVQRVSSRDAATNGEEHRAAAAAAAACTAPAHLLAGQALNASPFSLRLPCAASDSRNMLEAFFVGRALAEVLNERLGAALGDALADFGRWDAETRQAIRCGGLH